MSECSNVPHTPCRFGLFGRNEGLYCDLSLSKIVQINILNYQH